MCDRRILSSDPHDWDELISEAAGAEKYSRRLSDQLPCVASPRRSARASALRTEQPIYRGQAEGWLVVPCLELS